MDAPILPLLAILSLLLVIPCFICCVYFFCTWEAPCPNALSGPAANEARNRRMEYTVGQVDVIPSRTLPSSMDSSHNPVLFLPQVYYSAPTPSTVWGSNPTGSMNIPVYIDTKVLNSSDIIPPPINFNNDLQLRNVV